jgi:hypothetical protein
VEEVQADPLAVVHSDWVGVDPSTDPVLATYFLFHDADLAALRAALPTVAGCDLADVYAEIPDIDPAALPSTYLLPTDDHTLLPSWMARVARERLGVEPVELAGGHNPYVAAPGRVADLVVAAVGAGAAV